MLKQSNKPSSKDIDKAWGHLSGGLFNTCIRISAISNLVDSVEKNTVMYETTDGTVEQNYQLLKKRLNEIGKILSKDYEVTSKYFDILYAYYFGIS